MLGLNSPSPSFAGTNFLIRSNAFNECGWMPEYTLTEDYALGMELKMRQWQACGAFALPGGAMACCCKLPCPHFESCCQMDWF